MKPDKPTFFSDAFFSIAKKTALQLLFPRTCPLCGRLLSLPPGWAHALSVRTCSGAPSPDELQTFRSILLCEECQEKIRYVSEPKCRICSRPIEEGEGFLCDQCIKKEHAFSRGSALLVHDDVAKKILYDLKFRNMRDNADWIGFEMAFHMAEQLCLWQPQVLLPVPLHKKRKRERGFNQAALIADHCSFWLEKLFDLHLPVDEDYLQRILHTRPQRTLQSAQRSENVRSAFSVSGRTPYRSVVLVDDIFTSGSTLDACSQTLRTAGTQQIFFLAASIVC